MAEVYNSYYFLELLWRSMIELHLEFSEALYLTSSKPHLKTEFNKIQNESR